MKAISIQVTTSDVKPDERGYPQQYNRITLLEANVEDTPDERAKLMQLVRVSLIGEIQ